jgi:hypothetical protein
MWIPGIEPGQEALQTSALPSELNPRRACRANAANGGRTHDLSVDNRTLIPLSYGDEIGHQIVKERVAPHRCCFCVIAAGGIRTHTQTVLETAASPRLSLSKSSVGLPQLASALSRIRTCNNVTLDHAPLPNWATRAFHSMDAGGSRTLISWLRARSPAIGRRAHSIRLARSGQSEISMVQAGFEPALT